MVLSKLTEEKIEIIGCSRTDAGVHALAQIANFKTTKNLAEIEVKDYLNQYLPKDISVIEVKLVDDRFHARYNAKNKTYLYKIWNKDYSNPFMRKYSMHVEYDLNMPAMKEASKYFLGTHNFTAYSNAKSKKKSMVREIYSILIEEQNGFIIIRINGNGFLYNMVRKIVGSLIEVGLGQVTPKTISNIILSKDRSQVGRLADACGLYLEHIEY